MINCARCGFENPDGSQFCANCGYAFTYGGTEGEESTPTPPPPPPGNFSHPSQAYYPPPTPGIQGGPYQQQYPYPQQYPYQYPYLAVSSNGKATASLILGIVGIFVCPIVCSVAAIILGYSALNEIAASQGWQTGEGYARAGIILGWIGVVLSVAVIVIAAILPL